MEGSSSQLAQWPVEMKLIASSAPYYDNAHLLIAADCTAFAYASFHKDFMQGHTTVIGCPKLDAIDYADKLSTIIRSNKLASITVVRMEVPCCGGLVRAARKALEISEKVIPFKVASISTQGKLISFCS